ncbi:unnamed protein product [Blepharisma stoltei]|uniref:Uncharacterized protein n=1 Tax=Blepharisma stoltei TaxID=1481888 RepID=A0AAU9IZT9_9CILI|nr:unnamed protein product [Blepharisma stoltei]
MKNKVIIEICFVFIGDNKNYICSCNSDFAKFRNMTMRPCEDKQNCWIIINGFNKIYKHYIHDWYNKYFPPWFLEYCVLFKEGVSSVEKFPGSDSSGKTKKMKKFRYQTVF